MLQVIAVDDIVQAADIAFIDQKEIDSLDELFEEHAKLAAEELERDEAVPFKRTARDITWTIGRGRLGNSGVGLLRTGLRLHPPVEKRCQGRHTGKVPISATR